VDQVGQIILKDFSLNLAEKMLFLTFCISITFIHGEFGMSVWLGVGTLLMISNSSVFLHSLS